MTLLLTCTNQTSAADSADSAGGTEWGLIETLLDGKMRGQLRYRYEHVDDDLTPLENANASTLRVALGWETGVWNGFNLIATGLSRTINGALNPPDSVVKASITAGLLTTGDDGPPR